MFTIQLIELKYILTKDLLNLVLLQIIIQVLIFYCNLNRKNETHIFSRLYIAHDTKFCKCYFYILQIETSEIKIKIFQNIFKIPSNSIRRKHIIYA